MATSAEIVAIGQAVAACARAAKSLNAITDQTLSRNTVESFDWAAADADEANAALSAAGVSYSSAEVSNAIGSLAAFQTYWGTHGGNFEKLTDPIV
ncbi:hypothetical protein [Lignipirellula cremea]|uniref:Uncharacterized protein n=1 Tax=Lignipirellula cremea TaxID=2528010 RepID=A0A518E096_9BACT|nr:hypothetical protein [Lignipirellula cremea]QDU97514.1 hypothetical protein Pla8534_53620 [Lignipirellula cremea]